MLPTLDATSRTQLPRHTVHCAHVGGTVVMRMDTGSGIGGHGDGGMSMRRRRSTDKNTMRVLLLLLLVVEESVLRRRRGAHGEAEIVLELNHFTCNVRLCLLQLLESQRVTHTRCRRARSGGRCRCTTCRRDTSKLRLDFHGSRRRVWEMIVDDRRAALCCGGDGYGNGHICRGQSDVVRT